MMNVVQYMYTGQVVLPKFQWPAFIKVATFFRISLKYQIYETHQPDLRFFVGAYFNGYDRMENDDNRIGDDNNVDTSTNSDDASEVENQQNDTTFNTATHSIDLYNVDVEERKTSENDENEEGDEDGDEDEDDDENEDEDKGGYPSDIEEVTREKFVEVSHV